MNKCNVNVNVNSIMKIGRASCRERVICSSARLICTSALINYMIQILFLKSTLNPPFCCGIQLVMTFMAVVWFGRYIQLCVIRMEIYIMFSDYLHLHYIYSFSRRFYPKQLPRESFTKVHRSLIIATRYPQTLQVVRHEEYIVKTKIKCQREES